MNWITELLFNAGSGGLFGMIGSLTTSWMRLKEKRVDNEHSLKLLQMQAASAEAVASWTAFTASHNAAAAETSTGASPWAINTRIVTRPYLTGFLVVGSFLLALVQCFEVVPDAVANSIQSFHFLTGTAVAWWFGSRMTQHIQGKK